MSPQLSLLSPPAPTPASRAAARRVRDSARRAPQAAAGSTAATPAPRAGPPPRPAARRSTSTDPGSLPADSHTDFSEFGSGGDGGGAQIAIVDSDPMPTSAACSPAQTVHAAGVPSPVQEDAPAPSSPVCESAPIAEDSPVRADGDILQAAATGSIIADGDILQTAATDGIIADGADIAGVLDDVAAACVAEDGAHSVELSSSIIKNEEREHAAALAIIENDFCGEDTPFDNALTVVPSLSASTSTAQSPRATVPPHEAASPPISESEQLRLLPSSPDDLSTGNQFNANLYSESHFFSPPPPPPPSAAALSCSPALLANAVIPSDVPELPAIELAAKVVSPITISIIAPLEAEPAALAISAVVDSEPVAITFSAIVEASPEITITPIEVAPADTQGMAASSIAAFDAFTIVSAAAEFPSPEYEGGGSDAATFPVESIVITPIEGAACDAATTEPVAEEAAVIADTAVEMASDFFAAPESFSGFKRARTPPVSDSDVFSAAELTSSEPVSDFATVPAPSSKADSAIDNDIADDAEIEASRSVKIRALTPPICLAPLPVVAEADVIAPLACKESVVSAGGASWGTSSWASYGGLSAGVGPTPRRVRTIAASAAPSDCSRISFQSGVSAGGLSAGVGPTPRHRSRAVANMQRGGGATPSVARSSTSFASSTASRVSAGVGPTPRLVRRLASATSALTITTPSPPHAAAPSVAQTWTAESPPQLKSASPASFTQRTPSSSGESSQSKSSPAADAHSTAPTSAPTNAPSSPSPVAQESQRIVSPASAQRSPVIASPAIASITSPVIAKPSARSPAIASRTLSARSPAFAARSPALSTRSPASSTRSPAPVARRSPTSAPRSAIRSSPASSAPATSPRSLSITHDSSPLGELPIVTASPAYIATNSIPSTADRHAASRGAIARISRAGELAALSLVSNVAAAATAVDEELLARVTAITSDADGGAAAFISTEMPAVGEIEIGAGDFAIAEHDDGGIIFSRADSRAAILIIASTVSALVKDVEAAAEAAPTLEETKAAVVTEDVGFVAARIADIEARIFGAAEAEAGAARLRARYALAVRGSRGYGTPRNAKRAGITPKSPSPQGIKSSGMRATPLSAAHSVASSSRSFVTARSAASAASSHRSFVTARSGGSEVTEAAAPSGFERETDACIPCEHLHDVDAFPAGQVDATDDEGDDGIATSPCADALTAFSPLTSLPLHELAHNTPPADVLYGIPELRTPSQVARLSPTLALTSSPSPAHCPSREHSWEGGEGVGDGVFASLNQLPSASPATEDQGLLQTGFVSPLQERLDEDVAAGNNETQPSPESLLSPSTVETFIPALSRIREATERLLRKPSPQSPQARERMPSSALSPVLRLSSSRAPSFAIVSQTPSPSTRTSAQRKSAASPFFRSSVSLSPPSRAMFSSPARAAAPAILSVRIAGAALTGAFPYRFVEYEVRTAVERASVAGGGGGVTVASVSRRFTEFTHLRSSLITMLAGAVLLAARKTTRAAFAPDASAAEAAFGHGVFVPLPGAPGVDAIAALRALRAAPFPRKHTGLNALVRAPLHDADKRARAFADFLHVLVEHGLTDVRVVRAFLGVAAV